MHRTPLLRCLAFVVAAFSVQCLESLSDDCTKTLTCPGPTAELRSDCRWYFPDGGAWTEGPRRNERGRWVWPDGRETETQNFYCESAVDAGVPGDAGTSPEDDFDCRVVPCDAPRRCDLDELPTPRCVECLENADCAGVVDADVGAQPLCDPQSHTCVACLGNADCQEPTTRCKTDGNDPDGNQCVQCLSSAQCSGEDVCDTATNECTVRCTGEGQCTGSKPICNLSNGATSGVCVECRSNDQCADKADRPQCNTASNQCVECVTDDPCTASGRVCGPQNRCVQCNSDSQCSGDTPYCDLGTNTCVECLSSSQCGSVAASRCNPVSHECVPCTADIQCEPGAPFCQVSSGRCVACTDDSACGGDTPSCDLSTGTCVGCVDDGDCRNREAARCNTTNHECVGCNNNNQCAGKFGVQGLCNAADGDCVECIAKADCAGDAAAARCNNETGLCSPCLIDDDCSAIAGRPACRTSGGAGLCVQCTENADCAGSATGPVCKTTNDGSPAPVNTCVECVQNSDCPNPAESRCVQNQCQPCTADAECSHVRNGATTLGVCDTSGAAGVCVQCTGAKRQACGTNVCNSLTKVCTNFAVGSAGTCDNCVSDAHCSQTTRCAFQDFDGNQLGPFCFPVSQAQACSQRGFAGLTAIASVDGTTSSLCFPRATTCAALRDTDTRACSDASDCGVAGLNDGECDTALELCTVPCIQARDCPAGDGLSCPDGVCEL